jgi:5-methylcytosine-specific restriction endonuclease McrA
MSPFADKEQRLAYHRQYYELHRSELSARQLERRGTRRAELAAEQRAYYEAHRAEQLIAKKAYFQSHREEIAAQREIYRAAKTEDIRAAVKAYRELHKLEIVVWNKEYRKNHRAEIVAYQKLWRQANPELRRAALNRSRTKRRGLIQGGRCDLSAADWADIQRRQDGRCAICGEVKPLTRDHIIPLTKGGEHTASNIQGLCAVCNARKGNRLIENQGGNHAK